MQADYDVYGVGNALVDVQALVTDSVVERLGFTKGIMTLADEHTQLAVLSSLQGAPVSRCAGGSAANTIMGLASLGGRAAYAGKVGLDELGEFWLQDLRAQGVTIPISQSEGQSGTCVILITEDAQRTMLTHLGLSSTLGPDDILEEDIRRAKYVYVEGYLFTGESTTKAALRTIELAKKHGVKVAFTVSDPFVVGLNRDLFLELIRNSVDLLFCNLEEARSLTSQTDPVDCAQAIHKHATDVALTLGAEGSLLMHGGTLTPIEGVPVQAIDTTGAGDMYAAGILYGLTSGLSWRQAGHLASHGASRIVSQMGARLASPITQSEIATLVAERK